MQHLEAVDPAGAIGAAPDTRAAAAAARRAGRLVALARAALLVAGVALVAASAPAPIAWLAASGTVTTMRLLPQGDLQRLYVTVAPAAPVAAALPAIVFLHGSGIDVASEAERDGLLPLVSEDRAVLVYPVGYDESWNAGPCCSAAREAHIDDAAFLSAVVAAVRATPGVDRSRVFIAGYSQGGKMAFDVACREPEAFAGVAIISAVAITPCAPGPPIPFLLVAGTADPEIPFPAGAPAEFNNGVWNMSAGDQVDAYLARDACAGAPATATSGQLTTQRWTDCPGGAAVELAAYAGAGHDLPEGGGRTPPAAAVVWSFVAAQPARPPAT